MTLEQLQARLREAHEAIGCHGRFSFTLNQSGGGTDCYVTHWFRPTPYAFEDCRTVGSGTVAECLDALDRYVAVYRGAVSATSRATVPAAEATLQP